MTQQMIQSTVDQLVSGTVEGSEIMNQLRQKYASLHTIRTKVRDIRAAMIRGGHTSKDYDQSLSLLRAYADEPAVHIFLCSPLGA